MIIKPPEAPLPLFFENNGKRFLILHQNETDLLWTGGRTHCFHHHPEALGWDLVPEECLELLGGVEEFYLTRDEFLDFYAFTKQHTYHEAKIRQVIEEYDIDHVFLRRAGLSPDSAMLMIADMSDAKYHAEVHFLYGCYLSDCPEKGRRRIESELANPRRFFPAILKMTYNGRSVSFAADSVIDSFILRTMHITNDLAEQLGIRWRLHRHLRLPDETTLRQIDEWLAPKAKNGSASSRNSYVSLRTPERPDDGRRAR